MEISTPFLELMLGFREIEGHETITTAVSVLFTVTFLFARVFYFGFGLYRSLMFWQAPTAEAMEGIGDRVYAVIAIQALYTVVLGQDNCTSTQLPFKTCYPTVLCLQVGKLVGIIMGKSIFDELESIESAGYADGQQKTLNKCSPSDSLV